VNLSADPEQEYFVDGVVEEMITAIRTLASYLPRPYAASSDTIN
jgi:hypothetical protein